MPRRPCGVLLVLCVGHLVSSSCPPGCCCPGRSPVVLCESLGLRSLPRSVPLGTSALSVARNQLCDVDHLLRPYLGLQELSLSHNLLARLPRGLPPSLESLQLQENRITYITTGALRQLVNLTRLDLEDNRIRAIQPGALQSLGRLRILTLRGNKLTHLPRDLPPSLIDLDLSANCISTLDLPSLSSLVNLQVLRINSNCLSSVPERAFDGLPRLRSVDLSDNLWVCECDILYLYRWLLGGRLKMATDLVCHQPDHLAHRLLLSLSVTVICPRVLTQYEVRRQAAPSAQEQQGTPSVGPAAPGPVPRTRLLLEQFSLQTLSYEECLSLNRTATPSPTHYQTTSSPEEDTTCTGGTAGPSPQSDAILTQTGPGPLLSTNREVLLPTPGPGPLALPHTTALVALLALLCVLVTVLILAVMLVLKKALLHQQRVAPLQQS